MMKNSVIRLIPEIDPPELLRDHVVQVVDPRSHRVHVSEVTRVGQELPQETGHCQQELLKRRRTESEDDGFREHAFLMFHQKKSVLETVA